MGDLRCAVCGMLINSKNFGINRYSFMEMNTEDHIISCPFCGVGSMYLSEGAAANQLDNKSLSVESKKILDNAMKLEVFNSEFYLEASRLAKSEEVRRMFKDLSSIELTHARVHMKLGGFKELPRLRKPDYSKHDKDGLLLAEAAKREKHAVHFYERNLSRISSDVIKQVLAALSEVEKQHIEKVGQGDRSLVPQSRVTSR